MKSLITTLFLSLSTSAGGLMSVSGQMVACDDEICKIKVDKAQIYQISLKKLSPLQQRELIAKKKDEMISTAFPMNAIIRVDDAKK